MKLGIGGCVKQTSHIIQGLLLTSTQEFSYQLEKPCLWPLKGGEREKTTKWVPIAIFTYLEHGTPMEGSVGFSAPLGGKH